jgi:hypothetical protein
MTRRLRRVSLALALALAAAASMAVLVARTTAAPDRSTRPIAVEQPSVEYAAVDRVSPEPRGRPVIVAASTPTPTEEPTPLASVARLPVTVVAPIVAAPLPVATAAAPAVTASPPAVCPANFFCYPRLGIAGAIVPYNDCSGATDVGLAIRQLTCVRAGIWLAGHAYTQFGGITGYRVGDVVFALGRRFEITGASVQRSCAPATGAIAPLSLQTSLETATCGSVLVVQGR